MFFHHPQRAELAYQFKTDMDTNTKGHSFVGTLASGCNGTGKSGIRIEAFATSAANNHIEVYVPSASAWVNNALRNTGNGYFLEVLLKQNADLIVCNPALLQIFEPLLHDPSPARFQPEPQCEQVMSALVGALKARPGPAVGVIVDEVQHITRAIEEGRRHGATAKRQHAGDYFKNWHNWDNENKVFVRMDIASSHGQRELKLPSGEDVRLKIVRPWNAREVDAALSNDKPLTTSSKRRFASASFTLLAAYFARCLALTPAGLRAHLSAKWRIRSRHRCGNAATDGSRR